MSGFVYPLFFGVIERAGVHFCLDVLNDDYRNVLVLLSKKGNKGASDQVFMMRSFGHFALIATLLSTKWQERCLRSGIYSTWSWAFCFNGFAVRCGYPM